MCQPQLAKEAISDKEDGDKTLGAMRLLTLILCWCFATCCLATRGRGSSQEREGHQGQRAWEPLGGLKQLRRLQEHGVNLEHLSARGHSRPPAKRNHLSISAGPAGVQALNFPGQKFDESRLEELMRKRRRAEGRWRVSLSNPDLIFPSTNHQSVINKKLGARPNSWRGGSPS